MSKDFHFMAQPVSQSLDRDLPPWVVNLHLKQRRITSKQWTPTLKEPANPHTD